MMSSMNTPEGSQVGDSSQTEGSPQSEGSRQIQESSQTGDIRQAHETSGSSAEERRRGRPGRVLVGFVVAGALLVLGFAPLARLTANGLPRGPGNFASVATGPRYATSTAIQAVPVGLPDGARIRTASDVFPYAVAVLGKHDAVALMALLDSKSYLANTLVVGPSGPFYPYRYPPLEALLGNAPPAGFASGATALGAALTVLAAQPQNSPGGIQATPINNAGPIAYGVLNHARAAGGCAPQLDLLLLLTADAATTAGTLTQEEQRAEAACPHNPTPAWLVGQSELRDFGAGSWSPTSAVPETVTTLQASSITFSHLATEYPRDIGVLTGLGDSYLRTGTYLRSSEPFTARQDFRLAIAAYDRASALGGERDAAPGIARALIGLGDPAAAARLVSPITHTVPFPGQLLDLLITADEAAHDFGPAATAAQRQFGLIYPAPSAYRQDRLRRLPDRSRPTPFLCVTVLVSRQHASGWAMAVRASNR